MKLEIDEIAAPRSFIFLWCGSGEGLDLGRVVRGGGSVRADVGRGSECNGSRIRRLKSLLYRLHKDGSKVLPRKRHTQSF